MDYIPSNMCQTDLTLSYSFPNPMIFSGILNLLDIDRGNVSTGHHANIISHSSVHYININPKHSELVSHLNYQLCGNSYGHHLLSIG